MADPIDALKSGIASIGYTFGLPGMGITEPMGTQYNVNQTPASVYNATAAYTQPIPTTYNATTNPQGYQPYSAYQGSGTTTPVTSNPNPPPPTQQQSSSLSFQQMWEQAGHAGTAPVGYHGESGGSGQPDISAQIDALYNPSFDYLNQAESKLNSQYPSVLNDIQGQYDVNSQTLNNQNTSANAQLDQSGVAAGQRKDDVLSSARRMYDELRRGYQQRFGGSTSAGQAASEISSVEQQRQMGLTQRSYGDTMAQIDFQKSDLNRAYSTSQLKLKTDTDTARNQANSDFQSKLLSIQQNKAQIQSAKAQASLDALQSYRNQVFSINQQNLQFQQTLDLQKSQAATQLDTYAKQLALAGQGSQTALQNYYNQTPTPTSNLQVNGYGTTTNPALTGKIGGTFKGYDQNGQPIYG